MYVGAGEGLGQAMPGIPSSLQLLAFVQNALVQHTRTPEGYVIFFLRLTLHPFPSAEEGFVDFFLMSNLGNNFTKQQIIDVLGQIRDDMYRRDHHYFRHMLNQQRQLQSEMLTATKNLKFSKIKPFLLKLSTASFVPVINGERIVTGAGRAFARKFAKQMLPPELNERLNRSIAHPSHFARLLVYLDTLAEAYRLRRTRK